MWLYRFVQAYTPCVMAWCQCAMETFSSRHMPDNDNALVNVTIIFPVIFLVFTIKTPGVSLQETKGWTKVLVRESFLSLSFLSPCGFDLVGWALFLPLLSYRSQHVWRRGNYRPCVRQRFRSCKGWLRRRRCPQGRLPLHRWPPPSPGKQQRKSPHNNRTD